MTRRMPSSAVSLVFDFAPTSESQSAKRQVQGQGQEDKGQHPLPPTRLQIHIYNIIYIITNSQKHYIHQAVKMYTMAVTVEYIQRNKMVMKLKLENFEIADEP